MATIGLLLAVMALIWMALRGVNIILASVICSIMVAVSNGIGVDTALAEHYSFGKLGAFTFVGKFFWLFAAGAIFGRVMAEAHLATSLAHHFMRLFGHRNVIAIMVATCALLTYGGVVVFVVIFSLYPLGLRLCQETGLPKRLLVGAVALGAGTFTMTALPGTPSIHNVLAATALKTSLFAAPVMGMIATVLMAAGGMAYLLWQQRVAAAQGEVFTPNARDQAFLAQAPEGNLPGLAASLLPIGVVLAVILLPQAFILTASDPADLPGFAAFARSQPILWPALALMLGTLVCVVQCRAAFANVFETLGKGTDESIMPLVSTAAVIGFGGVVVQTPGFQAAIRALTEMALGPEVATFVSVNVVAGITGSAAGGLQIFLQTMAPALLAKGIDAATLHRFATIASGGLDSLPHCGAIIATLTITGLTHREGYKDLGVVTVVVPTLTALILLAGLLML